VSRGRRLLPGSLAALAGCAGPQSTLDPAGPAAAHLRDLMTLFGVITVAAAALVIALLLWVVARAVRVPPERRWQPASETAVIVGGGVVFPVIVLVALAVINVRAGAAVSRPPTEPRVTIEVVAHQYWWEVRYPDLGIVTANELIVPVGEPVRLVLRSADVIHSFWVPRLHGKLDHTPGHTVHWWLQADEPGVSRGQCAEYCGLQHALMGFLVVAEPPDRFEAWAAQMRALPAPPTEPLARRGREVFFEAACQHCHAIRGTVQTQHTGHPGPDLTHLATRRTLAAATVDNTPGALAAFILDPHGIKPGNRMPATPLDSERLQALVAYLGTLR
jgi:cytochrome c oxidase subunit 2